MKEVFFKSLICIAILTLFSSPLFAKGKMYPIEADWKLKYGDDLSWMNLSSDNLDSSWKSVDMPQYISTQPSDVFWLKASVQIPSEFKNKNVYFESGNSYGAMEIYVGGAMTGHHGTLYPKVNFSHVSDTVATIPSYAIKNGKVDISIRCRTQGSHQTFNPFYIVDQERYNTVVLFHPFLNNYVYYMMAAVCFFLGLYFLFQFIANHKDKASLAFSFTLATVAVYFFDMASDILYLPFNIQLSVARSCFVFSIGGLVMFIRSMFKIRGKAPKYFVYTSFILIVIAYIACFRNTPALENLFTIGLAPVFIELIYIYVMLIKAHKAHSKNAKTMLIGISLAMIFAVHDIVYQVIGVMPFAWLQGFAFFFIDITMFIVVSLETIENKRQITDLAVSSSEQKDKLNMVIQDAARLSSETMEIAGLLNDSVQRVALAAQESETKAQSISSFITNQNESMRNTSSAVEKLVQSVENVNSEIQLENEVANTTVNETKLMVEGVNQAAAGIDNAASFAKSLGQLTEKSTSDIESLVRLLDSIKQSSAEIMNVIKIVSDFSRKTNMLAMNASIEAAHSGDAGKGFAVIAHEINALAGQSSEQTSKIDDIIVAITENIAKSFELSLNVKKALNEVSSGALSTAQIVQESARGMEVQKQSGVRINEATKHMTESVEKVNAETQEQASYSSQVSSNMKVLNDYANQAEAAVDDVLSKNKELTSQAQELKSLASRIKDASRDLDNLIKL